MSIEKKKVLLADDEKLNQMVVNRFLLNLQLDVEIADNGKIAFEKAQNGTYDLFLLDINMPEMDGYEAAIAIRKLFSDTPIIALTGCDYPSIAEQMKNCGFNDYIEKPVNVNVLNKKVEFWLNK